MGCQQSIRQVRPLPPPDVVKQIESMCSRFVPLDAGDKSLIGVDRGFRITAFLDTVPTARNDVAQIFLQHLSQTARETMVIANVEIVGGHLSLYLIGTQSMQTLRVFSEEFADPVDPLIEFWVERLQPPPKKRWIRPDPGARYLTPIQDE